MRAKICFLIVVTYSSNFLVSFGDVDGDIKLDDEGVVSVYSRHYKAYLNICWIKSKSKRDSVSNTICRQMGLAKAESSKKLNPPQSKIHNQKIAVESCTDDASHIYRCTYYLETFCNSRMIFAVTCAQTEYVYEGQLRLVHPLDESKRVTRSFSEGMLEVFLNNRATFVCNETFGENEATTACRQLGYTTSYSHRGETSNGQNKVWIGFNKRNGTVDCDEPEDCLTKCYTKPAHEGYCESGIVVYLQCDFVTQNLNSEHSTAGSPSACAIKEISASKKSAVVGIVLGSISLIFICTFGILIALYCYSTAKKPPNDLSDDRFDYSYANDRLLESFKESKIEEEETSFSENVEYRPPVITQLAENTNNA